MVRALCGKGKEESVAFSTLVPFLDCLEGNSRAFENKEQSIHGCKSVLLCNLWAWTRGFFGSGPSSVVDFVDWLGPG